MSENFSCPHSSWCCFCAGRVVSATTDWHVRPSGVTVIRQTESRGDDFKSLVFWTQRPCLLQKARWRKRDVFSCCWSVLLSPCSSLIRPDLLSFVVFVGEDRPHCSRSRLRLNVTPAQCFISKLKYPVYFQGKVHRFKASSAMLRGIILSSAVSVFVIKSTWMGSVKCAWYKAGLCLSCRSLIPDLWML